MFSCENLPLTPGGDSCKNHLLWMKGHGTWSLVKTFLLHVWGTYVSNSSQHVNYTIYSIQCHMRINVTYLILRPNDRLH